MINKEFKLLDKGFVRFVDFFGDNERIVQAARVTGKGTTTLRCEFQKQLDFAFERVYNLLPCGIAAG